MDNVQIEGSNPEVQSDTTCRNPVFEKGELLKGAMTMPTSGIIGSLCVAVLLNTMLVHLGTVCFYKDTPAVTALQQEAVMSTNMIVDAGMISCSITACGAVSKSGRLGAVRPLCVLLADSIILMDVIQSYHQVRVPMVIVMLHDFTLHGRLSKRLHYVLRSDAGVAHLFSSPLLQSCQEPYVMGAGQALELLNPVIQLFYVNAKGLVSHQLPDVVGMVADHRLFSLLLDDGEKAPPAC